MADITNAEAIRFVNDNIRPMAETVRDLKVQIDETATLWFSGINAAFSRAADPVADGRDAEGVSRLDAADVTNLMTQLIAIQTTLDGAGVMDVVTKPTVRRVLR